MYESLSGFHSRPEQLWQDHASQGSGRPCCGKQRHRVEQVSSAANGNRRILLVFQKDSRFPWMTVLKNAAFGLEMQGGPKSLREAQAGALLHRIDVLDRGNSYPHQLLLGIKQGVAVIRCFLSKPGLMLMDEPFYVLGCFVPALIPQENIETIAKVLEDYFAVKSGNLRDALI